MRAISTILCVCSLLSCGGDKSIIDGTGADSGSAPVKDCDITINATQPEDGTTDHYYRDPIRFFLSEPDGSAEVLTDISGSTTTEAGGSTILFTPDEPLEPGTSYSVGLDYCHGTPEIGFQTSSYGAALDSDLELEGDVFALDLTSGDYTAGQGAGELLNAIFTRHVIFELEEIQGDELSLLVAISKERDSPLEQDECGRTVRLEGVDISELPYFSADVSELVFGAYNGELRFTRFMVDGTISADGGRIGGISFSATMAVDEISRVLPDMGGIELVCQFAENLGLPCEACPSDDFALCITVAAEHILAQGQDINVVEVDEPGQADDCEE
jgi:hypothetical protein